MFGCKHGAKWYNKMMLVFQWPFCMLFTPSPHSYIPLFVVWEYTWMTPPSSLKMKNLTYSWCHHNMQQNKLQGVWEWLAWVLRTGSTSSASDATKDISLFLHCLFKPGLAETFTVLGSRRAYSASEELAYSLRLTWLFLLLETFLFDGCSFSEMDISLYYTCTVL